MLAVGINACEHAATEVTPTSPTNPPDTTNTGGGTVPDTSLRFERDILPVFISNCAKSGCHDAASRQDGYEFTSYATITAKKFVPGEPDETELYEKITENDHDKIMPPPPNAPLTTVQIGKIYEWIRRGAPNTTGCQVLCDPTAFLYARDIQPVFRQYCTGCHSAAVSSGGIALDGHSGAAAIALNGKLMSAIRHLPGASPMPQGGDMLPDCKIWQIEKWVASGAPNN
jgi:hypothetical protein